MRAKQLSFNIFSNNPPIGYRMHIVMSHFNTKSVEMRHEDSTGPTLVLHEVSI